MRKSEAALSLLLCAILALCAVADKVGDAIDTRETMAVEAATSVTQAYDKIRQDGISTDLCKDVTAYTFPDMCMPNADYAGEYPSVTENSGWHFHHLNPKIR